jgi:adenylylsulfate kinase-like enzyme
MEGITVKISGPFGCGKTTVQSAISEALREHGFEVENHEDDEADSIIEQKLEAKHHWFKQAKNDGRKVVIHSVQTEHPELAGRDRGRRQRQGR